MTADEVRARVRSRRRAVLAMVLALVAAFALGACGGDDDGPTTPAAPGEVGGNAATAESLQANPWRLRSYAVAGADDLTAAPTDSQATATYETDAVTGSTGCNQYNGAYHVGSNGAITFGPLASTKALCPSADLQAQEQGLLAGYGRARRAVIEDDSLQLLDARGNPVLLFDPAQ